MIIKNIHPFVGQHCETTATGSLLNQLGIELSEPMMFGLGEGLGFIFWNMKFMNYPFIGGRVKQMELSKSLANNLNLKLDIKETTSVKKAWIIIKKHIDENIAIGLQLDSYYLEYFGIKFHFAGHFVAMYGYDDNFAYLIDTKPSGGKVKTSLKSLELARNEKGPMSSKNLMYSLQRTKTDYNISDAIVNAITNNAKEYLNPPIKNIAYKGILKTSVEIKKWFKKSNDIENEFSTTYMLMEQAGTGGALFRNLYRDFLKEAYIITDLKPIKQAFQRFVEIAELWTDVAKLIKNAGKKKDENLVNQASDILVVLSEKEFSAMKILEQVV
ncbi:MAG: lantibiotic ABC transporter [Planctomycetota bacterium]|nr:MAG: lantibiotic ABC transporter [Planctomycetota bacterium]